MAYFPPWATPAHDQRILELGDIQTDAVTDCMAQRGFGFDGYQRYDLPIYFRAGSMTAEKAEQFGYGVTFEWLVAQAQRDGVQRMSDAADQAMRGTSGKPGCFAAGSDARLAAGADVLDIFDQDKLAQVAELGQRFQGSPEYAEWAAAWHDCMTENQVVPRQSDPLGHGASTAAVLSGVLSGEESENVEAPTDRTFDLAWFADLVAETPAAASAFEEERAIARVDAICTQETIAGLSAALAGIGY